VTSTGIVRVSRQYFRLVWAAFSYITQIFDRKVIIKVYRVSGTIRKCQQAVVQRNKLAISDAGSGAWISKFAEEQEDVEENDSDNNT
jgi:hypothetical protein